MLWYSNGTDKHCAVYCCHCVQYVVVVASVVLTEVIVFVPVARYVHNANNNAYSHDCNVITCVCALLCDAAVSCMMLVAIVSTSGVQLYTSVLGLHSRDCNGVHRTRISMYVLRTVHER